MSAQRTEPCATFVAPRDGLYGAYCETCGFSRWAHSAFKSVMCGAGCGRPVSIEHYPFCGPCALQKRLGHNVCSACGTPIQKDEQCAVCAQEEPIDGSR